MRVMNYNQVKLIAQEYDVMVELEKQTGVIPEASPKEYHAFGFSVSNNHVTELCLSRKDLSSLPESIGNLTSLTYLNLNSNKLSSLPDSLGNLKSLKTLILQHNNLTFLPESIGNLTSLTHFDLSSNRLSSLPDKISKLSSLTYFDVGFNGLSSLPEGIGQLKSLEELKLGVNKLQSIPETISSLTSLNHLGLFGNHLESLPETLTKMTWLKHLSITDYGTFSLSTFMSMKAQLKKLRTYGCSVVIAEKKFVFPELACKACRISISQHQIDEFYNLCKDCYWIFVHYDNFPRCFNNNFINEFEAIKVRKVTMETKKFPKQDTIYHFLIPNGISPEEWPSLDDSYYACDCYDPYVCDEAFVDHFESMIADPKSVRGVSMHYHHMPALRTIGSQIQKGKYQNFDYILMYNFLEDPIEMLEWQRFDKPEWSYYDLDIFKEVLEIFPTLKGYLQKGGFLRGNFGNAAIGPELRVLIFESLAVNENFFKYIFKHDFPKLQKFEVHIGKDLIDPVENINIFAPLFSGNCFPELTHLKLAGSYIADEIAYNIANAPLINQLKSLDLSGGLLHTRGAEILINILPKTNIEKLNLSYNVLDESFYNFINPIKNNSGHRIEITIDPQLDEQNVLEEQREMNRDIKKWMEVVGIWSRWN